MTATDDGEEPAGPSQLGWTDVLKALIAAGWLLVPAVQYVATMQRTDVQITGAATLPALVAWDLTPAYLVLLVATAAVCLIPKRSGQVPETVHGPEKQE